MLFTLCASKCSVKFFRIIRHKKFAQHKNWFWSLIVFFSSLLVSLSICRATPVCTSRCSSEKTTFSSCYATSTVSIHQHRSSITQRISPIINLPERLFRMKHPQMLSLTWIRPDKQMKSDRSYSRCDRHIFEAYERKLTDINVHKDEALPQTVVPREYL